MRSKFDEQLRLLNQEMMYMGTMIEDSIQKAIEALIAQNAQLAEKIMNSDSDVDHEQKKIENICFNLLHGLRFVPYPLPSSWLRKSQSCFQKNRMC